MSRDELIEAMRIALCELPRYSFLKDPQGNVRKVADRSGKWIEFSIAHELFDPIEVDAIAAKFIAKAAITKAGEQA